jgi:hypothetical protein
MQQILELIQPIDCKIMGKPFPAEVPLRFSRINGNVLIHHPDNQKVTKIVRPENVRRIAIQTTSISQVLKTVNLI